LQSDRQRRDRQVSKILFGSKAHFAKINSSKLTNGLIRKLAQPQGINACKGFAIIVFYHRVQIWRKTHAYRRHKDCFTCFSFVFSNTGAKKAILGDSKTIVPLKKCTLNNSLRIIFFVLTFAPKTFLL
jgi:hypothetical protein